MEVFGEPGVCAHPASESQVVGVLNSGLGGAVQGVFGVTAVACLELLGGHADLALLHVIKHCWAIHGTCADVFSVSIIVQGSIIPPSNHCICSCRTCKPTCFGKQCTALLPREQAHTYENLRVDDVADLHFTGIVQQVYRAICQVLQDKALPVQEESVMHSFPGFSCLLF